MSEQLELFPDLTLAKTSYEALWEFAHWAIQEGMDDINGGLDAEDIENKAKSLGLVRWVGYDPVKHGKHQWCEPGDLWYELCGPLAEKPT